MVTHPIMLGCGKEKLDVQTSSLFMYLGIFICTYKVPLSITIHMSV